MIIIKLSQTKAEYQLTQLHKESRALTEAFPGEEIQVHIEQNYLRDKINLIRFLRESFIEAQRNVIEIGSDKPGLAWSKQYVEKYFNIP